MPKSDRKSDPDFGATNNQDNFNNYSNYKTSKAIGDKTSADHWRDAWLGGPDRDKGRK